MNAYKMTAIALGFVGVWIIVRPNAGNVEIGQLISLYAAVGFSVSVILVKSLTRTDSVVKIIFWMLIIQAVIGLGPAIYYWQPGAGHLVAMDYPGGILRDVFTLLHGSGDDPC